MTTQMIAQAKIESQKVYWIYIAYLYLCTFLR